MKKLSISLIFTLMTVFASSAHAWPEVDHMNMCGAASKVIRDYKGNPKAWTNRDMYTESRKAALYFQANCPETKAGKIEKAVAKRVADQARAHQAQAPRPQPRAANCKDCFDAGYKKGFKDGKSVGIHNNPATSSSVTTPPSYRQPQAQAAQRQVYVAPRGHAQHRQHAAKPQHSPAMIQHGDHQHHSAVEKADCELTDALNRRAGPVVTIIKRVTH